MLAILYGLNAANSNCSCIFCDHDLLKDTKNDQVRIILNSQSKSITRSISEATYIVSNSIIPHKGYIRTPLIHIDFKNCVFDTLHFLLRISDKLLAIIMQYILKNDGNKATKDLSKRPRMKIFLGFLKNECEVYRPFFISERSAVDTDVIKLRSFNSNELEKIYGKISESSLSDIVKENDNEILYISSIFDAFYKIYLIAKNKRYFSFNTIIS